MNRRGFGFDARFTLPDTRNFPPMMFEQSDFCFVPRIAV
jgi:hypothetical protein